MDIKSLRDIYDPENYYRNLVKEMETDLAGKLDQIKTDQAVFEIELLALQAGHESYLKDVSARLQKYVDSDSPLPEFVKCHLSFQLKCFIGGMSPDKVVYLRANKGKGGGQFLRDRMIYRYVKDLTQSGEYSLTGSRGGKKSAFGSAADFFHLSSSSVQAIYEKVNSKQNLDSSHKCNSRVHAALRSSCSKNTA